MSFTPDHAARLAEAEADRARINAIQADHRSFLRSPTLTLTEAQVAKLGEMLPASRDHYLAELVNAYDYHRRPIAGVPDAFGQAAVRWHEEWASKRDLHIGRGRRAYEAALAERKAREARIAKDAAREAEMQARAA